MTLFERPRLCRLVSLKTFRQKDQLRWTNTPTPNDPLHDAAHQGVESLLVEKGLIDPGAVDEIIDLFEKRIGPRNGAKVVAHAWADPAYKKRLLEDGSKGIAELGFTGLQGEDMVVLENTPKFTTSLCALCAHATRGRRWAFRPTGIRRRPIAPASSSNRAKCWPSLASTWLQTLRFAFGTAMPRSATWCCRCGRPALTAGTKSGSPSS